MNIATFWLHVKEGLNSVFRNKVMSAVSIVTVMAALISFGVVLLITVNVTSTIEAMKRDLEVAVFMKVDAAPADRDKVLASIEQQKKAGVIYQYRIESRQQAYENLKNEVKDDNLLKGMSADHLPESFYIKLENPDSSEGFIAEISKFSGINKDYGIGYNKEGLDKLKSILKFLNAAVIVLMIILMTVSVLLIYNTIRVTVFARRNEIRIMKYIGSIDSFVRWPFIIEGILIGFFGGILSFLFTSQAYIEMQNAINGMLAKINMTTLKVLSFGPFAFRILMLYTMFGILIGGVGSLLSLRKHLNV